MAVKPTDGHINWISDDDPAKYVEPSAAKRLQGWIAEEKPPFQYFNWAWRLIDRWLQWAEAQSDENVAAIAAEATARADADTAEATARADADSAEATDRADADTAHANSTDAHGSTSAATADRIMLRDSNGRCQVAAPDAADDCARKADVDAISSNLGTFANNANGNPNIFDSTIDIDLNIAVDTWESIGPSSSGMDVQWGGLDVIPSGVDYIDVTFIHSATYGAVSSQLDSTIYARKHGSSEAKGADNAVCGITTRSDASGNAGIRTITKARIPVSDRAFDLHYTSEFTALFITMRVDGYGYNP